jgi:hypothetical protein
MGQSSDIKPIRPLSKLVELPVPPHIDYSFLHIARIELCKGRTILNSCCFLLLLLLRYAVEDAIVEVLGAQLLVQVHDLSGLICSKHVQEAALNSASEALLKVIDATLEGFY